MSDIKKEMEAYKKVWNTIRTSEYKHFENGSVLKVLTNFYNMYKDSNRYSELMDDYAAKLNELES